MTETAENRIKRMKMRSMRRGIKEMDMVLSAYASTRLDGMDSDGLDVYDAMLSENDHDLYAWVAGREPAPAPYTDLIADIAKTLQNLAKSA